MQERVAPEHRLSGERYTGRERELNPSSLDELSSLELEHDAAMLVVAITAVERRAPVADCEGARSTYGRVPRFDVVVASDSHERKVGV